MAEARPLKIMRIIARLNVGGPAIHVILLSAKLGPPAFESQLVCGPVGAQEGDMAYLAAQHGVVPLILPGLGREISLSQDIPTLWWLYCLMRRERPDVVHTHTAKAGFLGRVAAWLAGVPVRVHTFHGHVFHGYFGPRKTRFFLWLERLCARLSTRLITISPALRDELVHRYHIAPASKFRVIPLGLELAALVGGEKHKFRVVNRIPAEKQVIGSLGRLVPIKNHSLLLAAFARLRANRQDLHLLIVGDGESRAQIEAEIIQRDLGAHVTLTGWAEDVGPAIHAIDVLALTSNNEGTPTSLMQAMAAGVPVVATAVGGVPDLLEQGRLGVLVPPHDAPALAVALDQVLNGQHPDLKLAQQTMLERYDIARLASDLGQLYQELR
ncbi:MAG: glycosyltransferase family 4 protein [Anaerolineae bacterium]|nr:glycosyltransferase family 4 protein [Anaerolineae bacterium]